MKGEVPISVLSRYFRVPSKDLITADYPGRDVLLRSRVTNVSHNGVFIATDNPMPRGAEFEVKFALPGSKAVIAATCVVRWTTQAGDGRTSGKTKLRGMGLEFTKIGRKEKKAIERYIREFLTRMRKRAEEAEALEPEDD